MVTNPLEKQAAALLALGANLPARGDGPNVTLRQAIADLASEGLVIRAVSRFFDTPCFPAGSGPDYVNAAVLITTTLAPADVLAALHRVEARAGRERVQRWGRRTLDVDLLAMEDQVLPDMATQTLWRGLAPEAQIERTPETLILPHPRLQDRGFVLVPLAEIAPDWQHPLTGLTVRQMRDALPKDAIDEVSAR